MPLEQHEKQETHVVLFSTIDRPLRQKGESARQLAQLGGA